MPTEILGKIGKCRPSSVAKPFVVQSNGMIIFRVKGYNVRGYQRRIRENFSPFSMTVTRDA